MGIRSFLFGRDAAPAPTQLIGFPTDGGLVYSVNATTALQLSAVWRCLDILSNGVSQLLWREVRGNLELPPSRLVRSPLGLGTRREWTSYVVSCMALFDWAPLLKVGGYDSEGVTVGLLPLDPTQVMPNTTTQAISPFLQPPTYLVGTEVVDTERLELVHRSPTPGVTEGVAGVIRLARASFAAAIAAENYASRYWQSGGGTQTVLETDQKLPEAISTQISDTWRKRRAMGPDYAPVLDGGLKARDMGVDPTTQAAVEARREQVADIGRYFGIPTAILNAPAGDTETYNTTEQQGIHLLTFTLRNYIGAIEDAVSNQLPGGRRMEMREERLSKGSLLSQAQALQLATGGKAWMDVQEAREAWDLPPMETPDQLNPAPAPAPVPAGGPDNGQG